MTSLSLITHLSRIDRVRLLANVSVADRFHQEAANRTLQQNVQCDDFPGRRECVPAVHPVYPVHPVHPAPRDVLRAALPAGGRRTN